MDSSLLPPRDVIVGALEKNVTLCDSGNRNFIFQPPSRAWPPSAAKMVRNFCKFHAMIHLSENQTDRDLEKTLVLWINGTNYSAFFVEAAFDEIFGQNSSFHWYFHTFSTKISSKTPESARKCQRKLLFSSKIVSKSILTRQLSSLFPFFIKFLFFRVLCLLEKAYKRK
jgi:hypothetical protein